MKGRTKTNDVPEEQKTQSEEIQVNVSENDGLNTDDKGENTPEDDVPKDKSEMEEKHDYSGIPKDKILTAIKHNPQYSQFYLNKNGFVFVLGTPRKQMGEDAVLITVKDFK